MATFKTYAFCRFAKFLDRLTFAELVHGTPFQEIHFSLHHKKETLALRIVIYPHPKIRKIKPEMLKSEILENKLETLLLYQNIFYSRHTSGENFNFTPFMELEIFGDLRISI